MPDLVTVPNVHLLSVGTWECSTGVAVFTPEDLASMVESQDDPGVRTPIVKLGHVDARFDGEPAVGRIENLRLSDDGVDLYGDLVGVPKWLAEIIPSAFPDRSIEATVWKGYSGSTGHKHQAVLTALALLGVSIPAIESLEDIRDLYEGELVAAAAADNGDRIVVRQKVTAMPQQVRAAMNIDTIRAEFYENLPDGSWAWIREIWAGNDPFIIVDNDEGDLFKIPYTEGADGDPVFGEPVPVAVQYVPTTDDESDDQQIMLGRFAPQDPKLTRGEPTQQQEGPDMPNKALLDRLGLPEDASQEDIDTAVLAKLDEVPTPVTTPAPAGLPEGSVVLDEAQMGELVAAARSGQEARKILADQDRDRVLDGAMRLGKFPPARRDHYVAMWEKDPDGTRTHVEVTLSAGLIPVTTELGHAGSPESLSDDAIWAGIAGMSSVITTDKEA